MTVISIRGADHSSERRASFLNTVAAAFDEYVATYGYEPDAIVYTLAGITQASQIGWDINGASTGGVTSILALAAIHATKEAGETRQGLK